MKTDLAMTTKRTIPFPGILLALGIFHCVSYVHAFQPPSVSEELGCSPTLTILMKGEYNEKKNKLVYFDPLGIATDSNFARLREAELKHGRIAMLVEGMLVPFALERIQSADYSLSTSMLPRLQALNLSDCLKIVATCGFLDVFVFRQQDPKDMPGDYGTGYFGRRDKGINEWKLRSELENGRLAMLAIMVQLLLEITTESLTWQQQWGIFVTKIVRTL